MSKKLTRQETVDNAVGALHKVSGMVGIDSEKIQAKIRRSRSRSTDVETGDVEIGKEARRILEESLIRKPSTIDETAYVPSLSRDHVEHILGTLKREETKKEPRSPCSTFIELIVFIPLAIFLIYLGYTNLHNCPLTKLPEWLLVTGVLCLIRGVCTLGLYIGFEKDSEGAISTFSYIDSAARRTFYFWSIYGLFLMWGNWNDYTSEDQTSKRFCAYSVMQTSKILMGAIVFIWIVLALALCCCCCALTAS